MKKSVLWLIIFFVLLTSYIPKFSIISHLDLNIKKIIIENNLVLTASEINKKLTFLYKENLFFLKAKDIEKKLKSLPFIESFSIKKIYPNKMKLLIVEKKPIAILQDKKENFYISNKGDLIKFRKIDNYLDLPTVFGKGDDFYSLYTDLQNIRFPIIKIKSFYFFESGRWDLILQDGKTIKLPINDYLISLKNYMNLKKNNNINKYKIFDYRIKNQLILN
jgi:cell division protein FtsQ